MPKTFQPIDVESSNFKASTFKIGLVINPYAGIGGEAAYKGSDGKSVYEQGVRGELSLKANDRTHECFTELTTLKNELSFYTAGGLMGEHCLRALGFDPKVIYMPESHAQTSAQDTKRAIEAFCSQGVELIVFVGGDGTARDVCDVIGVGKLQQRLAIGIPSGVKMYSGVYGIHPKAVGQVIIDIARNQLVEAHHCEVRDIDEDAFRAGRVLSQFYGELMVPKAHEFVQQVKQGGGVPDELVLLDIACEIRERIDNVTEDCSVHPPLFIFGPGSTTAFIQKDLGLPCTLLGVDVFCGTKVAQLDASAAQLLALLNTYNQQVDACDVKLILTAIGGQGHLLGRGNQQLNPSVLRKIGRGNVWPVLTASKLRCLEGRALTLDCGESELNRQWSGVIPIVTGFNQTLLYRLEGC